MTNKSLIAAPRYIALIPAAGVGARMGGPCPKQYMPIAGKPMIVHALETFTRTSVITHTYVVVSADDGYIDSVVDNAPDLASNITILRCGGATRQESVLNGLNMLNDRVNTDDWILVHDAARPGLTTPLLQSLIDAVHTDKVGGLLALPLVDTIKRSEKGRAKATVPRQDLWAAQTPQMFPYGLLCTALNQTEERLQHITDDASAIEMLGLTPRLVEGSPRNFKVTLPYDVALAEFLLQDHKGEK